MSLSVKVLKVSLSTLIMLGCQASALAGTSNDLSREYQQLWDKEDYAGAVAVATKSIALNPQDSLSFERRAKANLMLLQFDKATADCNKAIALKKNLCSNQSLQVKRIHSQRLIAKSGNTGI